MQYLYSVVRFVPNPIRGEFVNLGLLLGSDDAGDWTLELISKNDRARKIDEEDVLPNVVSELERIAGTLEAFTESRDLLFSDTGLPEISEEWLRLLADESRNIVQYSHPQPVIADSLSDAIDKLWPLFIVENEPAKRPAITKHGVMSRFRKSLQQHHLGADRFRHRSILRTPGSHSPIDFAMHNGRVVQMTQCWSFQVQDTEQILNDVKSWAWTIRDVRKHGGQIVGGGGELEVRRDVRIAVLYASPGKDSEGEWGEAIKVFEDEAVDAEYVDVNDADRIAEKLANTLGT